MSRDLHPERPEFHAEPLPTAETLCHTERTFPPETLDGHRLEITLAPDQPMATTAVIVPGSHFDSPATYLQSMRRWTSQWQQKGLETIPLEPGDQVEFGREAPQTLAMLEYNPYISRHHAEVEIGQDRSVTVRDHSGNGTRVELLPL